MINTLILTLLLLGHIKDSQEMTWGLRIGERIGNYCFGCGSRWGEQGFQNRLNDWLDEEIRRPRPNIFNEQARLPNRYPPGWDIRTWKIPKGRTAFIDPDGVEWTEDKSKHAGEHWDRVNKWGDRLPEVDMEGNIIKDKHLGGT